MMSKRVIKAMALGICATLVFQPVAVYASEEAPIDETPRIEEAVIVEPIAAPSEDPEIPEPIVEEPAEPVPERNDWIQEEVKEAEDDIKAALPFTEVPQIPTDFYLIDAEKQLEKIDEAVQKVDDATNVSSQEIAEYTAAEKTAKDETKEAKQAANDAADYLADAVDSTSENASNATDDADRVEEMSAVMYANQAAAAAAKAEAQKIADDAVAEADAAEAELKVCEEKLKTAEDELKEAKDALDAANKEYGEANAAVFKAQQVLWAAKMETGPEAWRAIQDAEEALKTAKGVQTWAENDKKAKEGIYDFVNGQYEQAKIAAENCADAYEQAKKDAEKAATDLAKAELILKINGIEADEIDIYNKVKEGSLEDADKDLAEGLIQYKLFGVAVDVNKIEFTHGENGTVTAKYQIKGEDGELIEVTEKFKVDNRHEQNIHGLKDSAHWLVISTVTDEKPGKTLVEDGTVSIYEDKWGYEVDTSSYTEKNGYYWVINGFGYSIFKKHKFHPDEYIRTVYYAGERTKYKEVDCINYTTDPFYDEASYYRANKDLTQKDVDLAGWNKYWAEFGKNMLESIVNKPAAMEPGVEFTKKQMIDSQNAFKAADSKYQAVAKAYGSVLEAAWALNFLSTNGYVPPFELWKLQDRYNRAVKAYEQASDDFELAAENAGFAREEANRALAALTQGFNYLPSTEPGGPTEEEFQWPTYNDFTPEEEVYTPITRTTPVLAAAPAPAAVLGEQRARVRRAAAPAEVEEAPVVEEPKEAPAAPEPVPEVKAETKAATIKDEDTARAAAPIAEATPFPWWVLIILAAIGAVSIEEYVRRSRNKTNITIDD